MRTSLRSLPWKAILLVSIWLEMFCVESRPFFFSRNRPIAPSPDLLDSKPSIPDVEKIFELTKAWVDPDLKDLNRTVLLAKLGSNFDSFYMSIDPPKSSRRKNGMGISMRSASIERKNAVMLKMPRRIRQLRASSKLRQWLWELSRCPINYSWVDFGAKVFPRYIRDGKCIEKPCSFPGGMNCQPKGTKTLYPLIWICRPNTTCNWYPFPLTVNESCQCACNTH